MNLFLSLSYTNGGDWINYEIFYYKNNFFDTLAEKNYETLEIGYRKISEISNFLGINYEAFKFFILIFCSYQFFIFIKKSSRHSILIINIMYCNFWAYAYLEPIIRQLLATAICLMAINSFLENRKKKFVVQVFLGLTFHKISLIFFLVPFLANKEIKFKSKKNYFCIFVLILFLFIIKDIFIFLTNNISFFEKYKIYVDNYIDRSHISKFISFFKNIMFFLGFYLVHEDERKKTSREIIVKNLGYIFLIANIFSYEIVIFSRITSMLMLFYFIYIVQILDCMKNLKKILVYITFNIISLLFLVRIILETQENSRNRYIPYNNYIIEKINNRIYLNSEEKIKNSIIKYKKERIETI